MRTASIVDAEKIPLKQQDAYVEGPWKGVQTLADITFMIEQVRPIKPHEELHVIGLLSTYAYQQELQPSSAPELPPPSDPEQQLSSVSSLRQDAPTDVEPDLASVDSQPLSPPPSRQQRRLRVTSPHVASRYFREATNPGLSSREELDDSNDEDWSTSAEEDEAVTTDSEGDDSAEEDISINLIDVNVNQTVTRLIKADNCERRCLRGKARELEYLVCSVSQMAKSEKLTSVYSMLGVLMQTDTVQRRCGTGEREKFNYYLPFVGAVCRPSFGPPRLLDTESNGNGRCGIP
ncbi:unnamed protein product [Phytophthora fragariaefolia]|uniref:Unnamed protein product n=1 Tax=Phytophthora fragariaefolia TaxID=1490495 RepID=A0A9W6XML9_9STRA|nr:unnamed protein product [Phytophthora fragariaefolia]